MKTEPRSVYRSSGLHGFSQEIADHPRRADARKRELEVSVRFTPVDCTVATSEGTVFARRGDAILSGAAGEQWRVSRAHFADKYRPVAPTRPGEPGRYLSRPIRVMAVCMAGPFEVVLADGESRLQGLAGDWLVDYGDGSLGIVSADAFRRSYEIMA